MDPAPDATLQVLKGFTSALLHEVRTPLSALACEVEVTLRRDRSPAAYREALARIARHAADLVDLTSDFAVLTESEGILTRSQAANLEAVAAHLSKRYDPGRILVAIAPQPGPVVGDEKLLTRAFSLVLDHALRHHESGLPVRLRTADAATAAARTGVDLIVDADAPGFTRQTWQPLTDEDDFGRSFQEGLIHVRAASRIVRASGGSITAEDTGGAVCLRIHLRHLAPGTDLHGAVA